MVFRDTIKVDDGHHDHGERLHVGGHGFLCELQTSSYICLGSLTLKVYSFTMVAMTHLYY